MANPDSVVARFDTPQNPTLLAEIGGECVFRVTVFVGEMPISHGSSFIINHSPSSSSSTTRLWVLTNLHVARGLMDAYSAFRMVLASGMAESQLSELEVSLKIQVKDVQIPATSMIAPRNEFFKRVFQPHLDFTILGAEIPSEVLGRYFPFASRGDIKVGTTAYVLGFPADREISFAGGHVSHVYSSDSGQKKDSKDEQNEMRWTVQHDIETNGGNSGGPLISDTGRVLGIHARGLKMFRGRVVGGLNEAINIADVYDFIADPSNLEEISIPLVGARLRQRAIEDAKYGG